ncbi:hypothetical protein ACWGPW_25995, partial [Paenibacillus chitinolyticus]
MMNYTRTVLTILAAALLTAACGKEEAAKPAAQSFGSVTAAQTPADAAASPAAAAPPAGSAAPEATPAPTGPGAPGGQLLRHVAERVGRRGNLLHGGELLLTDSRYALG